jgi:hypothetical protein
VLVGAPETIQVRLVQALETLGPSDRHHLAALLSKWLDAAGISYTTPPMMGEPDDDSEEA